jgi:hypothetical protein
MNTAVLPALAIPSNRKHQPMKTSLQKRSLRTTGLALAIALGLGLAVDKAAAAIVVLPTPDTNENIYLKFDGANLTVSSTGYVLRMNYIDMMSLSYISLGSHNNTFSYSGDGFTPGSVSAETLISSSLTYNPSNVLSTLPNSDYYGFKYGTGSGSSIQYHYGWVNLTFSGSGASATFTLNSAAINTTAGESILAGQTTATAVPEPGTLLPAAALVAGALLRRRRGRASRSGSGAAA